MYCVINEKNVALRIALTAPLTVIFSVLGSDVALH